MRDELTRLLTETLRSREADVEPMPDLSAQVLQRGRSVRNRRRAVGWGATGVVAAVLAVAAAVLGPAGKLMSNPGPANSGTPSPSVTSPATVTKNATGDALLTYALKLPLGPPIASLPRAEKRGTTVVVVTADHVVTLPADTGTAFHLTSSAEGLLVTTHGFGFTGGDTDPDQALYLIHSDGRLTRLHKGPFDGMAVDPTGKQLAIVESAGGAPMGTPVRITIGSLSAPGTTASHTEPSAATTLLGWTTRGLLLSDGSRTWLWKPGESSTTEIPYVNYASVIPTDPGRLLVETGRPGAGFCVHLYTLSSRQVGPVLTCDVGNGWAVSPDGRHAVIGSSVVDLASGRVGPELMDKLRFYFPHWEDSTHILTHIFEAEPQGQPAAPIWVRCDVTTGACEQAPIKGSNGTWTLMDW